MGEGFIPALIGVGALTGTAHGFGLGEWSARRRELRAHDEEKADFELFAEVLKADKVGRLLAIS